MDGRRDYSPERHWVWLRSKRTAMDSDANQRLYDEAVTAQSILVQNA
jgi:hypothetical protein